MNINPTQQMSRDTLSPPARHAQTVAELCRFIESAEQAPTLEELAAARGHERLPLPPRLQGGHRADAQGLCGGAPGAARAATSSRPAGTVTEAIYDAGFNSSGRFYEQADQVLGMTPTRFRAGGAHSRDPLRRSASARSARSWSPRSERGVCAILLGDDPEALARDLQDRFPQATLIGGDAEFERLVAQVVGFVEAPALGLDLPLDVRGTAFQQRVWQALREIPAGRDRELCRDRASASARRRRCARWRRPARANALAVAIPCHRVVRSDGGAVGLPLGRRAQARAARARGAGDERAERRCVDRRGRGSRDGSAHRLGAARGASSTRRAGAVVEAC